MQFISGNCMIQFPLECLKAIVKGPRFDVGPAYCNLGISLLFTCERELKLQLCIECILPRFNWVTSKYIVPIIRMRIEDMTKAQLN